MNLPATSAKAKAATNPTVPPMSSAPQTSWCAPGPVPGRKRCSTMLRLSLDVTEIVVVVLISTLPIPTTDCSNKRPASAQNRMPSAELTTMLVMSA